MSDWHLKPLQVPELDAVLEVTGEVITFGRDPTNSHALPEDRYPHVSAHHARVVLRDGKLFLEDLGSKNGTMVNGQKVDRCELRNGDAIQLGEMGPRIAVVSSAGLGETISTGPVADRRPGPSRRSLGQTTILQVKKALGIPEEAQVDEMLQARSRRHNFKLGAVLGVVAVTFVVAALYLVEQMTATEAAIKKLVDRVGEQQADWVEQQALWEQGRDELQNRERELEKQLAQLQLADEESAKALQEQLDETKMRLDLYNPVNLEEAKLAKVEKVGKSVVLIERSTVFKGRESGKVIFVGADDLPNIENKGTPLRRTGTGSGFCVSRDGWIITNAHVVQPEGSEKPVTFEGEDFFSESTIEVVFTGTSHPHPAVIHRVAKDDDNDVALIKIEGFPKMPFVDGIDLTTPIPRDGTEVFLFGFPLGNFALQAGSKKIASTFKGIMSREVYPFLQVDAAVYPGNSGGPLTDSQGRIIGVVTAVQTTPEGPTAAAMGLTLPVTRLREIWPPPELDKSN